ncbi:MAG: hypothetical protein COA69_03775 [Robiginitomaculum sp.]|nr:MAG: hypothetical protein COA69_03775 [Robiginitomaculum sp.]
MTKFLNFMARTPVILTLFIASAIIAYGFSYFRDALGGIFLDMIYTGKAAQAQLAEMTQAQKQAHIHATLMLDILFPLALGGYMMGIAARLTKNMRTWAVLPAMVAIITDLCENTVQVLALSGTMDVLFLKTFLTPVKYAAFYTAALLALVLLARAAFKWIRARRKGT